MRTVKGSEGIRRVRLNKAVQFQRVALDALELADENDDVADAVAALCVHAGIAASDAICIARLGQFAQGQDHSEAVALLKTVDMNAAKHLAALLDMKSRAGYGYHPIAEDQLKKATSVMSALLDSARR